MVSLEEAGGGGERCNTRPTEVVFDPFSGSGTTLVACERLGRIGFAVEIDAGYVAVSLERLASMGLEPEVVKWS